MKTIKQLKFKKNYLSPETYESEKFLMGHDETRIIFTYSAIRNVVQMKIVSYTGEVLFHASDNRIMGLFNKIKSECENKEGI